MKYLWDEWPRILERGDLKKKKILFLDFDGTLTSISKDHSSVGLSEGVRKILGRLRSTSRIVIISGRELKDLVTRCGLSGVIYVGNHGLQVGGLDLPASSGLKTALKEARCMKTLVRKLRPCLRGLPGVAIEDKFLTVSIHHRLLLPRRRRAFAEKIEACRLKFAGFPVIWRRGKRVWEIRPRHNWGKGDAIREIRKRYSRDVAIAIGDDETDEDMFRAIGRSGLSIRVGRRQKSHARYYLKSPKDVRTLLNAL